MFQSSVDPNKIALTVKGLTALVPFLIVFMSYFQIDVGADELNSIIDQVANLVLMFGTIFTMGVTLYGAIRKVLVRFK